MLFPFKEPSRRYSSSYWIPLQKHFIQIQPHTLYASSVLSYMKQPYRFRRAGIKSYVTGKAILSTTIPCYSHFCFFDGMVVRSFPLCQLALTSPKVYSLLLCVLFPLQKLTKLITTNFNSNALVFIMVFSKKPFGSGRVLSLLHGFCSFQCVPKIQIIACMLQIRQSPLALSKLWQMLHSSLFN